MSTSIIDDIENLKSSNPVEYNKAFECLVNRKLDAAPALLEFLVNKDQQNRALAAAALATIADKSFADDISKFIDDDNPLVRAWSAIALRRMNDSRALQALLNTIDDYPDEAHYDQTLSTYALIQWGEEVLPPVIDMLNSLKWETRKHAFSVLKKIIFIRVKTKDTWDKIWKENGSYSADLDESARIISIEKWKNWIKENIRR